MILAVTGRDGGVGRSTLTLELAAAMDAAAVDADLGLSPLASGRGPDLHDALAGRAAPAETLRGGPVPLVPCGRPLAGRRPGRSERLSKLIRRATAGRDAVIDCPARRPAPAIAAADLAVILTDDRLATVDHDTRLLARHGVGLVAVVVTRSDEDSVTEQPTTPVVTVPTAEPLARSLHTGDPAVRAAPESAAAAAVSTLAARIDRCRPTHSSSQSTR